MAACYERYLFRLYRGALRGNSRALKLLVSYGIQCLEQGQQLPRGVARLLARELRDPANHAARIAKSKRVARGRPGIDDPSRAIFVKDLRALTGKRYFGQLPSEKNALMIQYLISSGKTLNEAPRLGRDSAVVDLAGLVDRSPRQLQRDYTKHRRRMTGSEDQLKLGKTLYDGRCRMRDIRKRGR